MCKEIKRLTKLVYGVGDTCGLPAKINKKMVKPYDVWAGMLERCYSKYQKTRHPSYVGCAVCEEWFSYKNFKEWFDENYREGYDLDKDLSIPNNRQYSPSACSFVPKEINKILLNTNNKKGDLPVGVRRRKVGKKFNARISFSNKLVELGYYSTIKEAAIAYSDAKSLYLFDMAEKYFDLGLIEKKVRDGLILRSGINV